MILFNDTIVFNITVPIIFSPSVGSGTKEFLRVLLDTKLEVMKNKKSRNIRRKDEEKWKSLEDKIKEK